MTRYGHRGSEGPQAYTFSKTLYENNFYLKVCYLENTPLNFCSIISKIKNLINIFAKKSNFPEIFLLKFCHLFNFNLTKKKLLRVKERSWGMSSKIIATNYQKFGKWRLVLCIGVIGPRVTFMSFFGGLTATDSSCKIIPKSYYQINTWSFRFSYWINTLNFLIELRKFLELYAILKLNYQIKINMHSQPKVWFDQNLSTSRYNEYYKYQKHPSCSFFCKWNHWSFKIHMIFFQFSAFRKTFFKILKNELNVTNFAHISVIRFHIILKNFPVDWTLSLTKNREKNCSFDRIKFLVSDCIKHA